MDPAQDVRVVSHTILQTKECSAIATLGAGHTVPLRQPAQPNALHTKPLVTDLKPQLNCDLAGTYTDPRDKLSIAVAVQLETRANVMANLAGT